MSRVNRTLKFLMRPFVYVYAFWLKEVEIKHLELTNEARYLQSHVRENGGDYMHYLPDGTWVMATTHWASSGYKPFDPSEVKATTYP